MGRIGPAELALLAFLAIMLFGSSRLSDVGRGLGDAIRNLKRGLRDDESSPPVASLPAAPAPAPETTESSLRA